MTKKMIALDLDGTLLRSDNTISDYTVETIKKIQNKGHLDEICEFPKAYKLVTDDLIVFI